MYFEVLNLPLSLQEMWIPCGRKSGKKRKGGRRRMGIRGGKRRSRLLFGRKFSGSIESYKNVSFIELFWNFIYKDYLAHVTT